MNKADAIEFDRAERFEQAANCYEDYLRAHPEDADAVANLLVLYWQATDPGISISKMLDPSFISIAGQRMQEIMESVWIKKQADPRLLFWSNYIDWAEGNRPMDSDFYRSLLHKQPDYLEPAMVLYADSGGMEMSAEIERLLPELRGKGTARARYVLSVLEGVMKRRRFALGRDD